MTPSPDSVIYRPPAKQTWLWWALAVLALLSAVIAMIAGGVTSYFRLSSDTDALRNGLIKSSGVEWRPSIALNMGGLTMGVVRAGMSFVHLDTEARAALQAVRGIEVGIYQLPSETKPPDRAAMLAAADTAMSARGWDRVVGVMDGHNLVTVYVSNKKASARLVKCCVMVFDGKQMIVASARANLEPLLECAFDHPAFYSKTRFLAKR